MDARFGSCIDILDTVAGQKEKAFAVFQVSEKNRDELFPCEALRCRSAYSSKNTAPHLVIILIIFERELSISAASVPRYLAVLLTRIRRVVVVLLSCSNDFTGILFLGIKQHFHRKVKIVMLRMTRILHMFNLFLANYPPMTATKESEPE
jgi:hypothetical protein